MLYMYALASFGFGFRRSKITRNDKKFSAYTKTTCLWNSTRLKVIIPCKLHSSTLSIYTLPVIPNRVGILARLHVIGPLFFLWMHKFQLKLTITHYSQSSVICPKIYWKECLATTGTTSTRSWHSTCLQGTTLSWSHWQNDLGVKPLKTEMDPLKLVFYTFKGVQKTPSLWRPVLTLVPKGVFLSLVHPHFFFFCSFFFLNRIPNLMHLTDISIVSWPRKQV